MRQTGDDHQRFAHCRHDDGCRRRGFLRRQDRWRSSGYDHIDVQSKQISGEFRKALTAAFGGAILNDEVLSLDVSEVAQALAKGVEVWSVQCHRRRLHHADAPDLA